MMHPVYKEALRRLDEINALSKKARKADGKEAGKLTVARTGDLVHHLYKQIERAAVAQRQGAGFVNLMLGVRIPSAAKMEPVSTYKCRTCGATQKWQAWSGRHQIALKCHTCDKLTLHEIVLPVRAPEEPKP